MEKFAKFGIAKNRYMYSSTLRALGKRNEMSRCRDVISAQHTSERHPLLNILCHSLFCPSFMREKSLRVKSQDDPDVRFDSCVLCVIIYEYFDAIMTDNAGEFNLRNTLCSLCLNICLFACC